MTERPALTGIDCGPLWRLTRRNGSTFIVDQRELDRLDQLQRRQYWGRPERCVIHECTVCGHRDAWRDSWQWYGSWALLDDSKPIVKICSEGCRVEAVRRGLVPKNAPRLDD